MSKPLTAKQQAFVREYPTCLNATEAARRAGYSERSAEIIGWENLRKPKIAAAIKEALQARSKRTELTQDEVIEGLRREAAFKGQGSSHSARVQALSWLGRHLAMFTDKSEVHLKGLADRIANMSEDEVRELLALSDDQLAARLTMMTGKVGHA